MGEGVKKSWRIRIVEKGDLGAIDGSSGFEDLFVAGAATEVAGETEAGFGVIEVTPPPRPPYRRMAAVLFIFA